MIRKKIIYSILKEIEQGNEPMKDDYILDLESWGRIAEIIRDEDYARPVTIQRAGIGNKVVYVIYSSSNITLKGLTFLEENNAWALTYRGIKEVRDWLKL